jgi:hypothetical protein
VWKGCLSVFVCQGNETEGQHEQFDGMCGIQPNLGLGNTRDRAKAYLTNCIQRIAWTVYQVFVERSHKIRTDAVCIIEKTSSWAIFLCQCIWVMCVTIAEQTTGERCVVSQNITVVLATVRVLMNGEMEFEPRLLSLAT